MNPIINLGFISIHLYSICLMVAVIIGYNLIIRESVRHGFNADDAGNKAGENSLTLDVTL